jgi:hypothetical protein
LSGGWGLASGMATPNPRATVIKTKAVVVQVYTSPDLVQFSSMVVQGSSPGGHNPVVALNKSAVKLTKIGNAGFMQQPMQDVGSTSREARQTPFLSHDTWSVNLVRGKVVLAVESERCFFAISRMNWGIVLVVNSKVKMSGCYDTVFRKPSAHPL